MELNVCPMIILELSPGLVHKLIITRRNLFLPDADNVIITCQDRLRLTVVSTIESGLSSPESC